MYRDSAAGAPLATVAAPAAVMVAAVSAVAAVETVATVSTVSTMAVRTITIAMAMTMAMTGRTGCRQHDYRRRRRTNNDGRRWRRTNDDGRRRRRAADVHRRGMRTRVVARAIGRVVAGGIVVGRVGRNPVARRVDHAPIGHDRASCHQQRQGDTCCAQGLRFQDLHLVCLVDGGGGHVSSNVPDRAALTPGACVTLDYTSRPGQPAPVIRRGPYGRGRKFMHPLGAPAACARWP